jgi:hypothetical protein
VTTGAVKGTLCLLSLKATVETAGQWQAEAYAKRVPQGSTMPYTLHKLGYETVPSDDSSYSTRVTIEDEGGEDECILLQAEEIDTELPIDIDEWPLIVQAVEKLLADRAAKTEAVQPAVTEEFLDKIGFIKDSAIEVLEGRNNALIGSFSWRETEQGVRYWESRQHGKVALSDDDKALLQSWVDAADYYEKNNG